MFEAILVLPVAAAAFVSTNLDNLLVLSALLAADPTATRSIVTGYGLAMAIVLAAAFAIAHAGNFIPPESVGLLGLVPLFMGLNGLLDLIRGREIVGETDGRARGVWGVAAAILSLSGDSLGVLVPLIAESPGYLDLVILAVLVALVAAWARIGVIMASRPLLTPVLSRWGSRVVPVLLIGIGVYVLSDSPTDLLTIAGHER